ncbi:hypothetical protein JB92DRAFT_2838164 [Gautieria morchelliformis]|nr:hypothetical protein JB92DRAFT_2838164 [Gautieria morchelliformis]
MATLWELVSEELEFRSLTSKWGNATSVTTPGSHMLQNNDPLPDRCVYDGNLLDALEDAVKNALRPIRVDPALTSDLESLQRRYRSRPIKALTCLRRIWFKHQRPDIRGQLTPLGVDVAPVDISIIELKSEGIVRKNWEAIVNRGREQVRLDWDGRGRWDVVDKILLKVTTYMVSYNMRWLCWTAASHLIVFRIVHHPPENPYLVISDGVQVDDTRKPDPDPVDKRIGERWMTCVVGCALAGLAGHSRGQFHFDVEDLSSTSGDPKVTPAEEEDLNALSDTTTSAGETSSGSNWTHSPGGKAVDAFLVFSKGEVPCALAAPLVGSPLLTETEQCDQEGLPYRYRKTMDILCSTVPRLNVNGFLGRGSTGTVFSGSWQGKDVAVKLAESEESRDRLHLESVWYGKIAEREQAKDILPTFFGRFRHSFFDVLVLSKEGNALTSWNDLVEDERLELFSMALKLHQAGLRHGDLEPRNVLRSTTGQLKLVDLSEASEHQCCTVAVESVIDHTTVWN